MPDPGERETRIGTCPSLPEIPRAYGPRNDKKGAPLGMTVGAAVRLIHNPLVYIVDARYVSTQFYNTI